MLYMLYAIKAVSLTMNLQHFADCQIEIDKVFIDFLKLKRICRVKYLDSDFYWKLDIARNENINKNEIYIMN